LGGKDNPSGAAAEPMLHADLPCIVLDPLIIAAQGAY
jgi:hypothetical protein